jgi:dTDP-glucose 4,6-dehydratase
MSTIVVLGSNSLSGAYFVDAALTAGYRVIGMSRSPEPHPAFLVYKKNPKVDNFTFLQRDINTDYLSVWSVIEATRPEGVVDFAGQSMVAPSWEFPWQWYQTNVVAKSHLQKDLCGKRWLKRYLKISTPEVYGHHDGLIPPDAPMNPSTPYAVSQAANEMNLHVYHRTYDLPMVISRYANFYGAGQKLYRIVPRAAYCAVGGTKLPLHGGGHSVRAFIHGKDAAQGMLLLLEQGRSDRCYHFSTDEFVPIRDVVGRIASVAGVTFEDVAEVTDDRPGKDFAYKLDCSQTIQELGWKPEVSLDEGCEEAIRWTRENWDVIKDMNLDYEHQA